jgi:hypothetical protein
MKKLFISLFFLGSISSFPHPGETFMGQRLDSVTPEIVAATDEISLEQTKGITEEIKTQRNLGSIRLIFAAYLNRIGSDFHTFSEPEKSEMVTLAITATKKGLGIPNDSNGPKDLAATVIDIEPSFRESYIEELDWQREEGCEFRDEVATYQTKPTLCDSVRARSENFKEEALERASKLSGALRPYLNRQQREKETLKNDYPLWENTDDDTTREIDSFWKQQ